jgi:hypothetical protein
MKCLLDESIEEIDPTPILRFIHPNHAREFVDADLIWSRLYRLPFLKKATHARQEELYFCEVEREEARHREEREFQLEKMRLEYQHDLEKIKLESWLE